MKQLHFIWLFLGLSLFAVSSCNEIEELVNEIENPKTQEEKQEDTKIWKDRTDPIIAGCTTDREKFYAIYSYICQTIAYDVDRNISDAETCWQQHKGVCAAYSKLFKEMAISEGLKIEIVGGWALTGEHAWNAAWWDNAWHLLDATWGAGAVDNNVFIFREEHDIYFDVDPYLFMLSHYPKDYKWTFIDREISLEQWKQKIPIIHINRSFWKLDWKEILYGLLDGIIKDMPTFYGFNKDLQCQILEIPLSSELVIGKEYSIRLLPLDSSKYMISNAEYQEIELSDGIHELRFTPNKPGRLILYVQVPGANMYSGLVGYQVN